MLKFLEEEKQNVVIVGDASVSCETMEEAVRASHICVGKLSAAFWGTYDLNEFAARQLRMEREGAAAEPWADGLEDLLTDCTVLMVHFNPVPRALMEYAPKLRVILTCRGGLEHIDTEAAKERNIEVINVIRNAVPVAEFAIGLMLGLTRNITFSHIQLRQGKWQKKYFNSGYISTLSNMTVGLVGLGNVGVEVAVRLQAMGTRLLAYDEYADFAMLRRRGLEEVTVLDDLEELFRRSDIVTLHLRLTPDTEHSIDRRYFSVMKPTAYFINTARGGLVNEGDLVESLRSHAIAGAALDVYDVEPLPKDSELLKLDNVLLTSHIAGVTEDAIPRSPFILIKKVNEMIKEGGMEE